MVSDALPEVCGIQLQHSLSKLCPSGALLVAPMAPARLYEPECHDIVYHPPVTGLGGTVT